MKEKSISQASIVKSTSSPHLATSHWDWHLLLPAKDMLLAGAKLTVLFGTYDIQFISDGSYTDTLTIAILILN
jgi:hypothetical protein